MRLNTEDKTILRKKIVEKLIKRDLDYGVKIPLDKELLEELMFERRMITLDSSYGDNKGKKVLKKKIIWEEGHLDNIDLSEVSFEDVVWDNKSDTNIDLKGTNAQIDFSKSFDVKWGQPLRIKNFYFEDTDLSNNFINYDCLIHHCAFDDTGIKFSLRDDYILHISDSSLSGVDLSHTEVGEKIFDENSKIHFIGNSILSRTGLRIKTTPLLSEIGYLSELSFLGYPVKDENEISALIQRRFEDCKRQRGLRAYLGQQIQKRNLDGCYVNGIKILDSNEKIDIRQEKLEEYREFKLELTRKTLDDIDKQINDME